MGFDKIETIETIETIEISFLSCVLTPFQLKSVVASNYLVQLDYTILHYSYNTSFNVNFLYTSEILQQYKSIVVWEL